MPQKKGKLVVAELRKRSEKGLTLAKKILHSEKMEYPKLQEALDHYLKNWADFTHPGLFSMSYEAVGGNLDNVESPQAAIAMMAAAFDIFDDIIDKSEDKHSIPTVYGKFGTDIAILLGNAFLIEGFNLFVESAAILPEETRKKALGAYKKLLFEVGNAHALEVGLKHEVNVDPDANLKVIEMKAAGIEADVYLGALFGRGTEAEVEASAKIGRILGILITLREEFVDVFELEELRQRIATQNLPLPLLFALNDQNAKKNIEEILLKPKITREDIDALVDLTLEAEPVKNLKKKMQLLMKKGSSLCYDLSSLKLQRVFQVLLQFMLEDL